MSSIDFNNIELIPIDPRREGEKWANAEGRNGLSVKILIDGTDIIDMIREKEKPYRDAEGPHSGLDYGHINAMWFLKDLDEAGVDGSYSNEFGIYLCCCGSCGEPGCWSVTAQVKEYDNYVLWHDFKHEHRDWKYEIDLYFDKERYYSAIDQLRKAVC